MSQETSSKSNLLRILLIAAAVLGMLTIGGGVMFYQSLQEYQERSRRALEESEKRMQEINAADEELAKDLEDIGDEPAAPTAQDPANPAGDAEPPSEGSDNP